ncbi:MAG: protease modulator HflC [Calditrichaceae bacterium]|nr:protease modulator HflC [Calditrichia bacterium]NUQ41986.1 protease modulator HflC [Calditrichaceae bacterium]
MRQPKYLLYAVLGVAALILILASAFVVNEAQQVIVTRFGEPVRDPITTPGIHFKMPFIEDARYFDKRFLEWDGDPNQVPTKDKRFIWVDCYGRWRIKNSLLFLERLQNEERAQTRLDDILDGETRNAIARHDLVEVIRSTNREFQASDDLEAGEESEIFVKIQVGRDKITRMIIETAAPKLDSLGIELLDLRFKRINYVEAVQQKIYERMITERKRIADKYRSEGQGEASKILGDKERDLKQIESEAFKTAQEIRGKADAEATAIYAAAYDRNADSREFYRFLKTMETYETALSEQDWLILSTQSDFFKFLQNQSGR